MRAREGARGFASAISFLTRFPLGSAAYDGNDLACGLPFFPLVGAAVGAGAALVAIGTGRFLTKAHPIGAIGAVAATGIIVAISIGLSSVGAAGIAVAVDALWSWHCSRRLGGVTGDTLGAGAELVQLTVLLTLVAALT